MALVGVALSVQVCVCKYVCVSMCVCRIQLERSQPVELRRPRPVRHFQGAADAVADEAVKFVA